MSEFVPKLIVLIAGLALTSPAFATSEPIVPLPGLGANEILQPIDCATPVGVTDPNAQLLGCYEIVSPPPPQIIDPTPVNTYYRVVRPVIPVPYPVLVPQPTYGPAYGYSYYKSGPWGYDYRYSSGYSGGFSGYGPASCGQAAPICR